MAGIVIEKMRIQLGDICNPFAVRGPGGRRVGAGIRRELGEVRALIGIVDGNDPNVRLVVSIGVRRAVAAKGE